MRASLSGCTSTRTIPGRRPTASKAIEQLGLDVEQVFKTLVADVNGTLTVAVVPVEAQLDLHALGKRARIADPKVAERATGYVTGGISPLGQRRSLPTVVDESALSFEAILVSAGGRDLGSSCRPPTCSRSPVDERRR